jgi:hypothetical protein
MLFPLTNSFAQSTGLTGTVLAQPCNNNGIIGVTATALTPPISYTYTNYVANITVVHSNINSVNDVLTNIPAFSSPWGNPNSWYVSASNGSGAANITMSLTPAFSFYVVDSVGTCPAPSTIQAIFSGGTPPYSCVWTNTTTSQVYTTNPAYVSNGSYVVVATDNAGCMVTSGSGTFGINIMSNSTMSLNLSGSMANCTNGTASVSVTGGNSPYSFLWSNSAVTQSIGGLTMGWYTCVVTDNLGCQKTGWYNVTQAVTINYNGTVNNATCLQNNGAVTSFVNGGTPPYTFLWSNSATTQNISGLTAGTYNVMISDANGCIGAGFVYVSATTPISVTYSTVPSSCTVATGAATIFPTGGASPYSILWYTFPSSTGNSISSKPPGSYSFKVTDANGCIRTGNVVIPQSGMLNASGQGNTVICPTTTGSVWVTVSGTNPPFTYAWSNSATTATISNVPLGAYSCTITDAAGCQVIKGALLNQTSLITIGLNANGSTCLYSANGIVVANASGGTPPYTYQWSNSQTGPTATQLLTGYYWVTATDANGCQKSAQAYVPNNATANNCFCTITGTVYADANSNCVRNNGENGIPNVQIYITGFGYVYTNSNGVYSKQVPSGTYTVTQSVQQIYPLASCQQNNQVVTVTAGPNCVSTVNFANNVIPLSDLQIITTHYAPPIPGNSYNQRLILQNNGTQNENTIKLGYKHDGQLSYSSNTPWSLVQPNSASNPTWFRVNSGFPTMGPGTYSTSFVNYNVPTNIPLNTQVVFEDTVANNAPIGTTWLTDNTPWNNVNTYNAYVVGSFDPNFKEVMPQGTGPQGNILAKDSILTYVVHFQNEGSYFAQNVVVVDTIDSDLRLTSMKPGYSTHRYSAEISETGVAKFTFANIYLPWKSSYGDAQSSGLFVYTIRLKKNLPIGTKITNRAAIYFDFNEPIITNTTLNTLTQATGLADVTAVGQNDVLLFPNPAGNYFSVVLNSAESKHANLSLYDISGRQLVLSNVELQPGANAFTQRTDELPSGIYFVQLKAEGLEVSKKLIIAR